MTIFTLEALAELTQELLNDPNLKHKNITEKAAIFGHASTVLSAQRYVATLENMSKVMLSTLEAQVEEIAKLNYENVPAWSARPDLAELHRRLEWALQSIKSQESSQ